MGMSENYNHGRFVKKERRGRRNTEKRRIHDPNHKRGLAKNDRGCKSEGYSRIRKEDCNFKAGSSSHARTKRRELVISRAEVESVGKQIESLNKQIDELKKRGEIVAHNKNSPFNNDILVQMVEPGFRVPDLPRYDGTKDPYEHVAAFDMVMNLRGRDERNEKDYERRECEQSFRRPHETREGGGNKPKQDKLKEPKYQPKYHNYTLLPISREKVLMMVENAYVLKWPRHTRYTPSKKFSNKYCKFHRERGHNTEECFQFKDEIERLVRQGYFRSQVPPNCKISKDETRRSRSRSQDRNPGPARVTNTQTVENNAPTKEVIYTIAGGSSSGNSNRARKRCARTQSSRRGRDFVLKVEEEETISFNSADKPEESGEMNDPMVIKLDIANFMVHKVLIESGSSADIIFKSVVDKMGLENIRLEPVKTPLVGFDGSEVASLGMVELPVSMGDEPKRKTTMVKFLVVDTPFAYNVILGRPGLNLFRAVVSTYHMKMKFPTDNGIGEVACDQRDARRCYNLLLKKEPDLKRRKTGKDAEPRPYEAEHMKPSDNYKSVQLKQSDRGKPPENQPRGNRTHVECGSDHTIGAADNEVVRERQNEIIRKEVDKLLKAGYVSEVPYTNWFSNVVLVPKSSGKWRMCVDFTDLTKACPKDPYPLPRIDVMVDSTAGFEMFSMMDAYQGYHQIYMAEEDRDKTSFITEKGVYCYNMMPFGLKNAGATYQRLVNKMFGELLGKPMEVYVDDMLVKSRRSQDHIGDLEQAFSIMRSYGMKLNQDKCTFGVRGGKFLGYMVSERGIEATLEKIQAVMNLRSPSMIKDVQKLTEKIASLSRSLPFFKVLRKAKNFEWSEECDRALQDLKEYLTKPQLLANPKEGETLFLYLAVLENAVSSVLVRDEEGSQNPIYYVSKMLQGAESRYTEMEKLALENCDRTSSRIRLIKWAIELGQYDVDYQPRAAQKVQVLADFVMALSSDPKSPQIAEEQISKWMLHVDGSSNASNGGAGILIQGPKGVEIEVATRLSFLVTNNEAEYEALILGLELAHEAGARDLEVFTDSQLIALQIEGTYETREKTMTSYKEIVKQLMNKFDKCSILQVPRVENDKADALSKFGAAMEGIRDRKITALVRERSALASRTEVQVVSEAGSWKDEIIKYLENEILPTDSVAAKRVKF
ncbi:UNVERIFIED_CONTAM: Retrovirus-related Pol polyprotein from transposon [Sesamum indicum]